MVIRKRENPTVNGQNRKKQTVCQQRLSEFHPLSMNLYDLCGTSHVCCVFRKPTPHVNRKHMLCGVIV